MQLFATGIQFLHPFTEEKHSLTYDNPPYIIKELKS
jgi:hypothetical protein